MRNKINSIKDLCEFIWYLETKYNLLEFEINDVKPWLAYRIEIYYIIGKSCNVFDKSLKRRLSLFQKISSMLIVFWNSIRYNPLLNLRKVDNLVFSHPRSKKYNGEFIDIYTHFLIDEIKKNEQSYIEMELYHEAKHIRPSYTDKRYLDYLSVMKNLKRLFSSNNLTQTDINFISKIEEEIENKVGVFVDISSLFKRYVVDFKVSYNIYKKILIKTKPSRIYVVVAYGRPEMIKAAKELDIEVIELQHGTFSKYHLGYSYPKKTRVAYFPNKFYVWNDFWKELIAFPITSENVIVYPSKYMMVELEKYKDVIKVRNQMLIIGQAGITGKIIDLINKNLNYFKEFKIILKLHPHEYSVKKTKEILNLEKVLDFTIVKDVDLYSLFAQSEFQAGVFSTALYEGLEFKCKTILFNLSGIEYMERFIESNKVKIIN